MAFNDLVKAADSVIFRAVGEPVTVKKATTGLVMENVMITLDRGIDVQLGDVFSKGTVASWRIADVGILAEGDRITIESGDVFTLHVEQENDGEISTWIVV